MLAGYDGFLVSEHFLERSLDAEGVRTGSSSWRQTLHRVRAAHQSLGPVSSLRSMLELGAVPLALALGFEHVDDVRAATDTITATLRTGAHPVVLVVTGWGQRLAPLWRTGVLAARTRGARWCVFFNGVHIRLIHCERILSRRFAEFDLDIATDEEQTAAALWRLMNADALSAA